MAPWSLLPSLLLCSLIPLCFSQQTQISSEKQSLLQIKNDYWGNPPALASWTNSTSSNYCNWFGITCSNDGSVTQLVLSSSNLTGEVPSSICQLKNLSHLDLYNNAISGSFPRFLSNCTNLKYLDLGLNKFTGEIPTSIGKMTQLQTLLLDSNFFNGCMPRFISNLTNLQQLSLAWNSFKAGTLLKSTVT